MTLADFKTQAASNTPPPANLSLAQRALWLDAQGDWAAAHGCVQQAEGTPDCDWVHAYLHRKEGDASNAAYWYRRAKRPLSSQSLAAEWDEIAAVLVTGVAK